GLLVLEVKGGRVAIADGQWMSGTHIINDPYQQALASRKALQRYLLERVPGLQRIRTGHGAVFPDVRIADIALGPEAAAATTIDRDSMANMPAAIGRLVAHWELNSSLSPQLLRLIKDQVAPTVSVRPLLREVAEDVTQQLLQLTQTQIAVLSAMRRQRRLIVYGGAGTGKTILAAERARQLADDGFQVLWWDVTLPANAPGYAEEVSFKISAVVVDEGQDFMPPWWESLELMMARPEEDPFYVFVDTAQQLYRSDWRPPFEGNRADLDINCRNTLEIANRVSALFGSSQPTLGTSGPEPQFVTAKSDAASLGKLEDLLELFLEREKLNPSQVVILSPQRPTVDLLRGRTLAGYGLVAPGEDGVVVETIQRFKGLEADVVILLLPQLEGDGDRALAYVGMSRASVQLVVVGPASVRAGLKWDD
ncbi:MAG: ATP-binding domain-containing protein, partial [Acidimicrobiia bacterium]